MSSRRTWPSATRSPARGREPNVVEALIAWLALLGAVLGPLAGGMATGRVLLLVGVSVLLGTGVGSLPRTRLGLGYLLGVVVVVAGTEELTLGPHGWVATLLGFLAGCVGGGYLADRRHRPARPSSATAPAAAHPALRCDGDGRPGRLPREGSGAHHGAAARPAAGTLRRGGLPGGALPRRPLGRRWRPRRSAR